MRKQWSRRHALGLAVLGAAAAATGATIDDRVSASPVGRQPDVGNRPGSAVPVRIRVNGNRARSERPEVRWLGARPMAVRHAGTSDTDEAAVKHTLTVKHVDRDGEPAADLGTTLISLDTGDYWDAPEENPVWKVELPPGRYHLNSFINTGSGDSANSTMLARPGIELDRDLTITLDARQAERVSIGVRGAPAFPAIDASTSIAAPGVNYGFHTSTLDWPGGVYTAHVGPTVPGRELVSYIDAQVRDERNGAVYALAPYWKGRLFTGLDKTYAPNELAKVTRRQLAQTDGEQAQLELFPFPPGVGGGFFLVRKYAYELPSKATVYYTANRTEWYQDFGQEKAYAFSAKHRYPEPKAYAETWNAAVFHPGSGFSVYDPVPPFGRNGNEMIVALFTNDAAGNSGGSQLDAGSHLTLYREGEQIGKGEYPDWGMFQVPPERGRFRVEHTAIRSVGTEYSTRIDCVWRFESERVTPPEGEYWVPMPMWTFWITPDVDAHNRVARTKHRLPLIADATPGSKVGELATPSVDISLDDGKTWTAATVEPAGRRRWDVVVPVSENAGYVSLRLSARDSDGNRLDETIVRAYGIIE